jgi:hypothetical protein
MSAPRFEADSESHRLFDGIGGVIPSREVWCREQYLAGQGVTPLSAPPDRPRSVEAPARACLRCRARPTSRRCSPIRRGPRCGSVDVSYVEYEDSPHCFLNYPGALSVVWRA